jgi:hypothetical protein
MGWIYAGAAWISLVLITGITAFMLHPGSWPESKNFWDGFFNPQFLPQVLARTGGSFLLASLYVYLHAAFKVKDPAMRDLIAARSARPALLGSILIVLGGLGWFIFLPESARAALAAASALNLMMALIFALTVAVFALLYFGPYRNPGWLSPGFAIVLFVMGLAAFSAGEFVREAVRKPYIVYNVVLGNQVLAENVPVLRANGYLEGGSWIKAQVAARYPQAVENGKINETKLLELPLENQIELGEMLFQYNCNNCHAAQTGFSAVSHLMRGWTVEMIRTVSREPEKLHFFMPPWAGTPEESELLTRYLILIAPAHPPGMHFGDPQ